MQSVIKIPDDGQYPNSIIGSWPVVPTRALQALHRILQKPNYIVA
jgi:hypothetical protein